MKLRMILAIAALTALTSLPIAAGAQNWRHGSDGQSGYNHQSSRNAGTMRHQGSDRGGQSSNDDKSRMDRTWTSHSTQGQRSSRADASKGGHDRGRGWTSASLNHQGDPGVRFESPYKTGHQPARGGTWRNGG